ncbi:hypothetical protein ALC62_10455 [Cyphomyrmex costatus]|uniref:Endonuclease/exonuclease/phosphatase domain-containing protein n=1 Tax=Cyphomyrmex costatus TaxID=456900 RepID=A0A151IDR0_9HYME|nr:hypothetical protein ALC62_10455 [Cyphomyrmex costatus]
MNGEKEGDEEGEWTFEVGDKRTVIDYGITNWEAWEKIKRMEIGHRIDSDHFPLEIEVKGRWNRKENDEVEEEGKVKLKAEWEELVTVIKEAVLERRRERRKGLGWVPWWDAECKEMKREVQKERRKYRRDQGEESFKRYKEKRSRFRETCERKKEEHKKEEEKEIEQIRTEEQASEEAIKEEGESKWEKIKNIDKEVDEQERGEKVRSSKSCEAYAWVAGIPGYMSKNRRRTDGKKIQMVARWRCGNELKGNMYWLKEEERKCRICGKERETLRHVKRCMNNEEGCDQRIDVLNKDGRGYEWMAKVQKIRRERMERERESETE